MLPSEFTLSPRKAKLLKIKKQMLRGPVKSTESALKKLSGTMAKMINFSNFQWRALIRDPERFDALKKFLSEQPKELPTWTNELKEIIFKIEAPDGYLQPGTSST